MKVHATTKPSYKICKTLSSMPRQLRKKNLASNTQMKGENSSWEGNIKSEVFP